MKKVVCVSPISSPNWTWYQDKVSRPSDFAWTFLHSQPKTLLERLVRKPHLARLNACRKAGRLLSRGDADILVSHGPLHTAWSAFFSGRVPAKRIHWAYTFNFTELPDAKQVAFMRRQFARVDRFTVFSSFEKAQYARVFDIPEGKIDMVHWAVGVPPLPEMPRVVEGDYICSIGGEGRDYGPLAQAAAQLPHLRFVIVARKKNLPGIVFPSNVQVFTDLPLDKTNNILNHALFSIVPLATEETACGHVTIVAGMHLGKAQIVTYSKGVEDYVQDGVTAVYARVKDPEGLRDAIVRLAEDGALRKSLGENALRFANDHCSEAVLARYVEKVLGEVRP